MTGQGNIRVSLVHSQKVTNRLIEDYLVGDGDKAAAGLYASRRVACCRRRPAPSRNA